MKVQVKKIAISNIRSFLELSEILFPVTNGLYHLTGDNLVDKGLGANGVGKSTLFCTLPWILFDKYPKGLRSTAIASWGNKKGSVFASCELEIDDEPLQIKRSWNPNVLRINGERSNTQEVVRLLGIDTDPFMNSVLVGQGSRMFLDLSSMDRSSLISAILGLNEWESRRDFSARIAKRSEKEINEIESDIIALSSKIDTLEDISYTGDIEKWEEESTKAKELYEDECNNLETSIHDTEISLHEAEIRRDDSKAALVRRRKDLDETSNALRKSERTLDKLSDRKTLKGKEYKKVKDQIEGLSKESTCYACGQILGKDTFQDMMESLELKTDSLHLEMEEYSDKIKEEKALCEALEYERKDADKLERREQEKSKKLSETVRDLNANLQREKSRLEDLSNAARKDKKNPWIKKESERVRSVTNAKLDRINLNKELQESKKENDHVSYWVKGFNQLRLDLIGRAIRSLENESNANLSHLGMGNWSIELSVDRETKSKTVTKGFHVMVKSPDSLEAIPLDVWSGGESQRLRLAITMGLSDMIQDYLGSQWGIEIYDEPCSWLSSDGIEALLSALKERAIRTRKAVWVVDHRSLGSGAFDRRAIMIKDDKGSRFQWE